MLAWKKSSRYMNFMKKLARFGKEHGLKNMIVLQAEIV